MSAARFRLGMVLATPSVLKLASQPDLVSLLDRHSAGDWGDVCDEDKQANDEALESGDRILSSYRLSGTKVWVITEADRSATTILLPEEY